MEAAGPQALPGKFIALAAGVLLLPIWAVLYIGDSGAKTSLPSSAGELSAVTAARSYITHNQRYRFAAQREAWIRSVRGQWEVHFPSSRSVTHTGGPIVTVDKASNRVVWMTVTD
jgi:hypothetical protein